MAGDFEIAKAFVSVYAKKDDASAKAVADEIEAEGATIKAKVSLDESSLSAINRLIESKMAGFTAKIKVTEDESATSSAISRIQQRILNTLKEQTILIEPDVAPHVDAPAIAAVMATLNTIFRSGISVSINPEVSEGRLAAAYLMLKNAIPSIGAEIVPQLNQSAALAVIAKMIILFRAGTYFAVIPEIDQGALAALRGLIFGELQNIRAEIGTGVDESSVVDTQGKLRAYFGSLVAKIKAKVDDTSLAEVKTKLDSIGGSLTSAGKGFDIAGVVAMLLSAANASVQFVAALAPALGILAAIPAVAGGAAAALGTLAVGFSGVLGALKLFGKATGGGGGGGGGAIDQTQSLQLAIESAAQGVKSAQQSLTKSYQDLQNAEYGVVQSEQSLQRAQRDAQSAQVALNQARTQAAADLASYDDQLAQSAIDEQTNQLAVTDAQADLNTLQMYGMQNTEQYTKAQLALQQAQLKLKESTQSQADLQKTAADATAAGVDGNQNVIDATNALSDAQQNVISANHDVQTSNEQVVDSQNAIVDAQEAVIEANQRLQIAQDQLAQKTTAGGGAVNQFNAALAKLSPNAQAVVLAITGLKSKWDELTKSVQQKLFEGVAAEITGVAGTSFPTLTTGMDLVATSFNKMFLAIGNAMQSPLFQGALATIFQDTAKGVQAFADAAGPLTTGIANLAAVGSPFFEQFNEWIANNLKAAGVFLSSTEGAAKMKQVIGDAVGVFQNLWQIAKNLGGAIKNIFGQSDYGGFLNFLVQITARFEAWTASTTGKNDISNVFKTLGGIASATVGALSMLAKIIGGIINFFQNLPGPVQKFIETLVAIGIVIGPLLGALAGIVSIIGTAITVVSALASAWVFLGGAAVVLGAPIEAVIVLIGIVVAVVIALAIVIVENWTTIRNSTVSVFQAIWNAVSSTWDAITSKVGQAVGWVVGKIQDFSSIPGTVAGFFASVASAIANKFTDAVNFVGGIPGKIIGALGDVGSMLYNSGQKIIQGLIDGIGSMANALKNKVTGVLSSIGNLFPHSPAKEGPFSGKGWTLYSGAALADGFGEGVMSRANALKSTVSSALGGAASGLNSTASSFASGGSSVPSLSGVSSSSTSSAKTITVGQLILQVNGSLDMTSETDKRKFISQVRDGLVSLESETR